MSGVTTGKRGVGRAAVSDPKEAGAGVRKALSGNGPATSSPQREPVQPRASVSETQGRRSLSPRRRVTLDALHQGRCSFQLWHRFTADPCVLHEPQLLCNFLCHPEVLLCPLVRMPSASSVWSLRPSHRLCDFICSCCSLTVIPMASEERTLCVLCLDAAEKMIPGRSINESPWK